MNKVKKFILYISFGFVLFIIFPFLTIFLPSRPRDYFFNEMSLQILYKKITLSSSNDSTRVMNIYQFVTSNMETPSKSMKPKILFPFQLILEGVGYCDQQSNILISLAEKGGIKGNLIFLYGFDSISHHSVCEVEINETMRMFDPLYKFTFRNNQNELASIKDIQDSSIRYPEDLQGLPDFYFKLYEHRYPYKICKSNELNYPRKLVAQYIATWLFLFEESLVKPYYNLSVRMIENLSIKKEKTMELLF